MADKKESFVENSEHMFAETLSGIEAFFIKNQKVIIGFVAAIILLVGGFFGYKYLYQAPRQERAAEEIFYAENYFSMDSIDVALNGDGTHYGFLDIIDNFKGTEAANLANYYVGVCHLKKGNFNEAINYLEKFKTSDLLLEPLSYATLGDAYAELEKFDQAQKEYAKAIQCENNDYITPVVLMKSAILFEVQNNFDSALKQYQEIRKNHIQSSEARDIDKHIARVEALINQ